MCTVKVFLLPILPGSVSPEVLSQIYYSRSISCCMFLLNQSMFIISDLKVGKYIPEIHDRQGL